MNECPNCGAAESRVLSVWEDQQDPEAEQPKFIACKACHRLMRTRLFDRYDELDTPPQVALTSREISQVPIGNEHTDERLTLIEWQCVKGAAVEYGVRDWVAQADPTLTKEENVALMREKGSGGESLRMQPAAHD